MNEFDIVVDQLKKITPNKFTMSLGFDGYVDEIISAVDSRVDTEVEVPPIPTPMSCVHLDEPAKLPQNKSEQGNKLEEDKANIQGQKEIVGGNVSLKAIEGPLINTVFNITSSGITLGRHSVSNVVVIPETYVSRRHCQVVCKDGNKMFLEDVGSTTGTFAMIKTKLKLNPSIEKN